MILVKQPLIASIIIISLMIISGIVFLLQSGQTNNSKVTRSLTIIGVMGLESFPASSSLGGPIGPENQDPYVNSSALTITQSKGNTSMTYYLYCLNFHSEMLISGGNGWAVPANGPTGDEIGGAYNAHLQVEVTGTPFNMTRWDHKYDLLNVSSIKILEPSKLPLIVYQSSNVESIGRVDLPQKFIVARDTFPYGVKGINQTYQVLINEGDVVGFGFNSTEPITLRILKPDRAYIPGDSPTHESARWDEVATLTSNFKASIRGEYALEFSSDKPTLANVTLNIWRIPS